MTLAEWIQMLGVAVVSAPAVLLSLLGLSALFEFRLSEQSIAKLTQSSVVAGLVASFAMLAIMLSCDLRHVVIELGNWVVLPQDPLHFHFHFKFVFDRLSVPFTILSFLLCGTVGAFTSVYLHRESGYHRFFLLYAAFLLGMIISSLAGTIETLFFGWELVGLSSALLVAFFHERPAPVRNGLRVWGTYRLADAAFLVAAILMHHLQGQGDLDILMGNGLWPDEVANINPESAFLVGSLLLIAAAGKSALVPFSGWLPRAMEGPTPSSAVFYGALSVHLGAYLLLRCGPLLNQSPALCASVVVLGLTTAVFGAIASRVQADVKCALAFASLTQVGIIVAEIGLGLRYIPLIHIIGHACLRTLQLLRAPSVLHDRQQIENALGRLETPVGPVRPAEPTPLQLWLYRFFLERAYLDTLQNQLVIGPFMAIFEWCNRAELAWTRWLSGPGPQPGQRDQEPRDFFENQV